MALMLLLSACRSGKASTAPAASPGPQATTSPAVAAQPSAEGAARFGMEVVARLAQEALYATGPIFIDPYVAPSARNEVEGALNTEVQRVRWAIATFPGPTKRTWFAAAPLTVKVSAFDDAAGTASVEVWVVSVFSREDLGLPETRFTRQQADLAWNQPTGSWRISKLATLIGPAAGLASDQTPSTPAELDSALAGHLLIQPADSHEDNQ